MPIKNYSTTVPASQSIGEITGCLVEAGATRIMQDYNNGCPSEITFQLQTSMGPRVFMLPANVEGVSTVLTRQKVKHDQKHALNVAWRNLKDWITAQVALMQSGQVEADQVFMPYMVDNHGSTMYQLYREQRLALPAAEMG